MIRNGMVLQGGDRWACELCGKVVAHDGKNPPRCCTPSSVVFSVPTAIEQEVAWPKLADQARAAGAYQVSRGGSIGLRDFSARFRDPKDARAFGRVAKQQARQFDGATVVVRAR